LEVDDRDPRTYHSIASLHADYRRWRAAIAAADRVLALNSSKVSALVMRGYAHRMSGALEVAASDFDRAIELDPSNDSGRSNRAALRNTTGNRDGALRDLNHCLLNKCVGEYQRASYRFAARAILGHAVGGDFTAALGDVDKSFKAARKRSSSIDAALYGLALSLRRGGDEERKTWQQRLAPSQKTWWHERLARLAAGEISFEQMDAETPFVKGRCKVLLAGGVRLELEGRPRAAISLYQAAEDMERPADLACALASICAASIAASFDE